MAGATQAAGGKRPLVSALILPVALPMAFFITELRSSQVRSADLSQTEPVNKIIVSRSPEWIVFSLDIEPEYETYRATIFTAGAGLIWRGSGLQPTYNDAVVIGFNATFFRARDYLLTLEGLSGEGRFVPVARYPFRVMPRAVMR